MQSVHRLLPVPLIIYPGIIDANKRWEILDKHLLLIYKDIGQALNSSIKDFEGGIQYFIAINNKISNLITRNISDYKAQDINVLSPKYFLNLERIKKIVEIKK